MANNTSKKVEPRIQTKKKVRGKQGKTQTTRRLNTFPRDNRLPWTQPQIDIAQIWKNMLARVPHEFRVSVLRLDDLLIFDLIFENLQIASDKPLRLVKKDAYASAFLIVEFPPQSFAEQD
jgi:hypothetical protein